MDGRKTKGEKMKTEEKNEKKDLGWNKLLLGSVMVFFLLLVAVLIGTLPALLRKPSSEVNQTFKKQSQLSGQDFLSIDQQQLNQQLKQCNKSLTAGSEDYDYSYSINSEQTGLSVNITSTLDPIGFVRITKVSTANLGSSFNQLLKEQTATENGTSLDWAQLQEMDVTMEYTAKLTKQLQCASASIKMTIAERETIQNVSCNDVNLLPQVCADELTEIGAARITVHAGTFDAKNYLGKDNETIWMSDSMPLLLKSVAGDTSIELVSYQKKA